MSDNLDEILNSLRGAQRNPTSKESWYGAKQRLLVWQAKAVKEASKLEIEFCQAARSKQEYDWFDTYLEDRIAQLQPNQTKEE
jgi:hypothetical protein